MLATNTEHMSEKLTKMIPNGSQNLCKIDPGGVWRPLGSHLWNKMLPRPHFWQFGLHFGTPFGTSLGSFWASFFWCFFEGAFWWPWPPFGPPKHLQNETQKGVKIKTWKSSILLLFTIHEPHLRVLKIIIFWCFFGTPFWDGFWSPFWWFWLTFGVPFGDHFGHFLDAIFASIFRHPKNIEKWDKRGAVSSLSETRSPPILGFLPPR